jgi:hypothetical protein
MTEAASQIRDLIEAINDEVIVLEGEATAADYKARQKHPHDGGPVESQSYIFQIQAMALKHKRSGLEQALAIVESTLE